MTQVFPSTHDHECATDCRSHILEIEDLAYGGDGVARGLDGRAVFVPFTIPGERVEAEIVEEHRSYLRARLCGIRTAATCRVEPVCPLFGRCGGCQYQHIDYPEQVRFKCAQLRETLRRIGGFDELPPLDPIIVSPKRYGYRNKITLEPFIDTDGEPDYGFFSHAENGFLSVDECPLATPGINAAIAAAKAATGCAEYGGTDAKHVWSGADLSALSVGGACPAFDARPRASGLARRASAGECRQAGTIESGRRRPALQSASRGASERLLIRHPAQGPPRLYVGRPHPRLDWLVEEVGGMQVRVPPGSFWQVNARVTAELAALVASWAGEGANETLVDAYAGVGLFSLVIGNACRQGALIESDRAAVTAAKWNHRHCHVGGRRFIAGRTERVLPQLLENMESRRDMLVVLDPPRTGCDKEALRALLERPVGRIIYVSCNPTTLGRDLKRLCNQGTYSLTRLALADMFPQTSHFECVAELKRPGVV